MIIDSPPLADVIDVLPLARYVDDVLIVARLGHTRLKKLAELADLMAENSIKPAASRWSARPRPSKSSYQYYVPPAASRSLGPAVAPSARSTDRTNGEAAETARVIPPCRLRVRSPETPWSKDGSGLLDAGRIGSRC